MSTFKRTSCCVMMMALLTAVCAGADGESWEPDLIDLLQNEQGPASAPERMLLADPNEPGRFVAVRAAAMTPNETNAAENASGGGLDLRNQTPRPDRQLWLARIGAAEEPANNPASSELERVMQQISAIRLKVPSPSSAPADTLPSPAETAVQSPAAAAPAVSVTAPEPNVVPAAQAASPGLLSEATLAMLQDIAQQPSRVPNPLELADLLYHAGYRHEAGVCYREALNRLHEGQDDPFQDRAWMLFQLGTCLQDADSAGAVETLRACVTAYPDSVWSELARAKIECITWRLQERPQSMIEETARLTDTGNDSY